MSDWIFASEKIAAELGSAPEKLIEHATVVKDNKVRTVYDCGKYFLKVDRRKNHSFAKEFKAAEKLSAAKIPVTEHLASGSCTAGNILITRACNCAVPLDEFIKKYPLTDEFLSSYTDFLNAFSDAGFYHADAHTGNILYLLEEKKFMLVDVRDIQKRNIFNFFKFRSDIVKFIIALRSKINDATLIAMMKKCGIKNSEDIFYGSLRAEARRIRAEWRKRASQLLDGYPKFAVKNGDRLISADTPEDDEQSETYAAENGKRLLLASFFLKLSHIPHREIYAADGKSVTVSPPLFEECDAFAVSEMQKRSAICGFETECSQWKRSKTHPLPIFCDLETLSASPLFDMEK